MNDAPSTSQVDDKVIAGLNMLGAPDLLKTGDYTQALVGLESDSQR